MSVSVADSPQQHRYEIRVDGDVAGFTAYRSRPHVIEFTHTEVEPRFEGQGLGSRLVGGALDDARARGLAVLPFCPFVRSFIARHDDYVELVPQDRRGGFGLEDGD
jgi:predicted GNAT family acetyltransferase